jgi:hypothetical protein
VAIRHILIAISLAHAAAIAAAIASAAIVVVVVVAASALRLAPNTAPQGPRAEERSLIVALRVRRNWRQPCGPQPLAVASEGGSEHWLCFRLLMAREWLIQKGFAFHEEGA